MLMYIISCAIIKKKKKHISLNFFSCIMLSSELINSQLLAHKKITIKKTKKTLKTLI